MESYEKEEFKILRSRITLDKAFLRMLYLGSGLQDKSLVEGATDTQIDLLLQIMHQIAVGAIPLKKKQFETLKGEKNVLNYVHTTFRSKEKVQKLIDDNSFQALIPLCPHFSPLLHSLFFE